MILIRFILLFLLFAPPLFAQDSYSEFERGLQLTDTQRVKVQEIKKRYIIEWQSLKRDSIEKRIELRDLYRNPAQNRERIAQLQNEVLEVEISRDNLFNQYKAEVSKILTEDQRERYKSFCDIERRKLMRPLGLRGYGR
jgi:Spy/CpxP family protein refolding chaperone